MPRWPFVAAVLSFVTLLGAARWLYDVNLSGVPDDLRMPVTLLPSFLFSYRSGETSLSTSSAFWAPWAFSSLAYLVPPALLAASLPHPKGALFGWTALGVVVIGSWLSLPELPAPQTDFVPSLDEAAVWQGVEWHLMLGILGSSLGLVFAHGPWKRTVR